jgi:hypothetical protein
LLALLATACSGTPPAATQLPRLAFYGLQLKQFRADHVLKRRLEEAVPRLVEEMQSFKTVPAAEIHERLKGRRGRYRSCLEAPCQVKVGRDLSAAAALAVRIERNLMQECDVFASLYELRRAGADQRSRARASCSAEELRDSVQRALCRVLVAARGGSPAEQEDRHRQCLFAAELVWLEQDLEAIRQRPLASSPEALVTAERKLAERALALKSRYQNLQRTAPGPGWSIAAECRAGGIYEAFAHSLSAGLESMEVPASVEKQGEAAVADFRRQMARALEERARPLRQQAAKMYSACLKRAEQMKVTGKYTEEARRRLVGLEKR